MKRISRSFTATGTVRIPMGKDREYNVDICNSSNLSSNRVYIKGPITGEDWTIGFKSYDGKGIVYQDRYGDWRFFRVYKLSFGDRTFYNKRRLSVFNIKLAMAIEQEKKITKELQEVFSDDDRFNITRLPYSGVYSRGTDIIVHSSEYNFDVSDLVFSRHYVHSSILAIEHLGVYKNKFCYGPKKDFLSWFNDCWDFGVVPVISWFDEDKRSWFVCLWEKEILENIFWTRYMFKKYGYRQRTNLSPISLAEPYMMSSQALYNHIYDMCKD